MPKIDPYCTILVGDCLERVRDIPRRVDSIVTDPPYGLNFMGKDWDSAVPGIEFWEKFLRVLKPGGYALIMGGTRTYHRLACNVEDAGFDIRDCLMWLYGTGFPKGKGNLKPGYEPILLARKPGKVLPFQVDECRIPGNVPKTTQGVDKGETYNGWVGKPGLRLEKMESNPSPLGRYPANVVHDGSEEVLDLFAEFGKHHSSGNYMRGTTRKPNEIYNNGLGFVKAGTYQNDYSDNGTVARFFYCAKPNKKEKGEGNKHPTVKPLALMEWLVKLITPEEGVVLDPFAGTGTTGLAALKNNRNSILIENNSQPGSVESIKQRLKEYGYTI